MRPYGYVVALTGGIGSGKTAVSDHFAALGVPVVDTDVIAHALGAPGATGSAAVAHAFGATFLDATGAIDRARLRQHVFAEPTARQQLEKLMHPLIGAAARAALRAAAGSAPYTLLVVPLLAETRAYGDCHDRILVVDCDEAMQFERVRTRSGLNDEDIRRILQAQASRTTRLAIADDVIDNRGDRDALHEAVERLHQRYLTLATLDGGLSKPA